MRRQRSAPAGPGQRGGRGGGGVNRDQCKCCVYITHDEENVLQLAGLDRVDDGAGHAKDGLQRPEARGSVRGSIGCPCTAHETDQSKGSDVVMGSGG